MNDLSNNEPCPVCGRFANRGVSVDAVIMKEKDVLLVMRGVEPYKGYWATPGGYVGWDESAEDAVSREVMEETGLHVAGVKLVNVYSDPTRHPKQVINLLYLVKVKDGDAKAGDDADKIQWFSVDTLPDQMAFDHKQNIQTALSIE